MKVGRDMSHKFRKPKPISAARRAAARANGAKSHGPVTPEGKAKSALNAITHGLTASALVLTTESKQEYEALLASYLDEYEPQGQTESDLVEELTAAKWMQRRSLAMITALLDITMDRMEKEIKEEFDTIDNAARTALAFAKQTDETAALALMHRCAARHARDYHRALDKLRQIQSDRRKPEDKLQTDHPRLATDHCILRNEPKPTLINALSTTSDPVGRGEQSAAPAGVLATDSKTGHRPLATDHLSIDHLSIYHLSNEGPLTT